MLGTFTLGKLFGVTLRVHRLVVAMLGVLLLMGALNGDMVVIPLACLVVALVAHELGHALVARRLGVHVIDVVLWPLGGMARMAQVPEDAGVEARIAAAGPAVNLALAAVTVLVGSALFGSEILDPEVGVGWRSPAAAAQVFLAMNLLLGVGNLLPAFPMDGGRLLRSGLVATGQSWLQATEIAVRVSRWIAVMMLIGAFLWPRLFWVLLPIGIFVLIEGTRELWTVRLRKSLEGAEGGARIDLGPLFRGAFGNQGPADPTGPARPAGTADLAGPDGAPTGATGQGFSEEDVERLETFRGRIKRPD